MAHWNELAVFAHVVRAGGFSAAADELGIAKATVSEHVRRLEQKLGVRLLQRSTRSLALTEAGAACFRHCERLVDEGEAATRADRLAKNPRTNYQAMFRSGSHQSATRGWLKPTWMTDSLVRKEMFGQQVGKGFLPDVHCPTGAPRESIVKITKAEAGGIGGEGLWRPAKLGLRPGSESDLLNE